ncbi:MAG: SPFH domain-containing protein [Firmicutes bacterium]|nr:SPFH domain-containing protein [Bacillota bacterium]
MNLSIAVIIVVILGYLAVSIKIVKQWEEMLVFTFGKLVRQTGPGLNVVWAGFQRAVIIDKRIATTEFSTEGTLSKDKVPVTLMAVLFWKVSDVKSAALEVKDYRGTIDLACQTALRDVVSRSDLEILLSGQRRLDEEIATQIKVRAQSWGIEVQNVEVRDLKIPDSLQEMLSRKAQAQAEKEARRIYGEAEVVAAEEYLKAAHVYEGSTVAFRLRGLNVLLEAVKSNQNTLLFLPTELTDMLRGITPSLVPDVPGAKVPNGTAGTAS